MILTTIIILKNDDNEQLAQKGDFTEKMGRDKTFEEFSSNFKKDLSPEVLGEAERLFDEMILTDNREEAGEILMEIASLGVYDKDMSKYDEKDFNKGAPRVKGEK